MTDDTTLICQDEQRREVVRREYLNGLDYLEVSDDQRTLNVYFLGNAPEKIDEEEKIKKKNVRIEGGRRIRDIEVVNVRVQRQDDPERDDWMEVLVDRPGDFSTYTLRVVELDEDGRPTENPMSDFDPRYARLEFSFKADCPSDLDCKTESICPPPGRVEPEIDYLAKDYASFRQLILNRLALIMPDWQERHVPDLGIALVEVLAYVGDHLSYYQDAVATEAYLETARQRISVRRHARLVDYQLHEGCNARAWVCVKVETDDPPPLDPNDIAFITDYQEDTATGFAITFDDLRAIPRSRYEVFEPLLAEPILIRFGDLLDPVGLVGKLRNPEEGDLLSGYLWDRFSEEVRRLLIEHVGLGADPASLQRVLVDELNRLIQGDNLYGGLRLPEGTVEEETRTLIAQRLRGEGLMRLNRLVLENVYPEEIARSGAIYLYGAHNQINFHTWGDKECCLPRGATRATLRGGLVPDPEGKISKKAPAEQTAEQKTQEQPYGPSGEEAEHPPRRRQLRLREGDVLIFEEVKGSRTGQRADADPTHRHAVRLTRVTPGKDELFDQPIVKIEWAQEDALPFPLCISAIGIECEFIEDISVARGNVILVDHGKTLEPEDLVGIVPEAERIIRCEDECHPAETVVWPGRFRPHLNEAPLTFSQPLPAHGPASNLLTQDPHQAMPQIKELTGTYATPDGTVDTSSWTARRDLLGSQSQDRHFVVEIDDEGRTHLRFGDGELGRMPEAGTTFRATYRVGNGPSGNVGAGTISHVVFRNIVSGVSLRPRNPLQARGGTFPEPLVEAKLFAPQAFRTELQRAVTADDYARLTECHPKVQRAAAALRWTGSWHEVLVAIDPRGDVEADDKLLDEIEKYLYHYRRIGHDLAVARGQYVPLEIAMEVCVRLDFLQGHVKAALLDLFSNRTLPDGRRGFFHPDNLSFGDDVFLSTLVAAAQAVAGVESVHLMQLERLGEGPNDEIENGVLPLGSLEIARLDNDPDFPENGRLRLEMRGGR